jgi:hypothetical protein
MATAPEKPEPDAGHLWAVRNYEIVCLVALLVLVMVLLQHGYGPWAFLPVGVGVLGVFARHRMRLAPVLLLLALLIEVVDHAWRRGPMQPDFIASLIQCGAVLAYVAGHYRLQGLTQSLVPIDPRERWLGKAAGQAGEKSCRRHVPPGETSLLLSVVLIFACMAQSAWALLPRDWNELHVWPTVWRLLVLLWVVGVGLLLSSGLLNYFARENMSKDEAAMLLQDVLWQEFRGEQRRANRWLAWAQLRQRRRQTRQSDRVAKEQP